jgi:hypothetical protein
MGPDGSLNMALRWVDKFLRWAIHMMHRVFFTLLLLASTGSVSAQQVSLCKAQEQSVFWCETKAKRFELCASKNLSASGGYMQYRAGAAGKPVFQFPDPASHPRGNFELGMTAKGTVLTFQNAQTTYEIYEAAAGGATISVTPEGKASVEIPCKSDSDTLTLTSTIDRFKMLGAFK